MTLFKAITQGGPVGFAHLLSEAWIAYRLRRVRALMESERALHRIHMAQLRAEQDHLELHQIRITHRAASYWKALS